MKENLLCPDFQFFTVNCLHIGCRFATYCVAVLGSQLTDISVCHCRGETDIIACVLIVQIVMYRPYSKAVDWWSFGVLLYEMLAGMVSAILTAVIAQQSGYLLVLSTMLQCFIFHYFHK